MKILTKYGAGFIKSTPRFGTGRLFDPFPRNPALGHDFYFSNCASGAVIIYFAWDLTDTGSFYYPTQFVQNETEAFSIFQAYSTFQSANGAVGFIGEWYNAQFRAKAFDKVPFADWFTWLMEN